MADDLQGLLDRIEKEGLDKAEAEKQRILEEARKEAEALIDKAKEEAGQTVATAKAEAEKLRTSGEADLRQAARDVLISLEEEVKKLLTSIVQEEVAGALTPERLSEVIYELAVSYAKNSEVKGLEVMANPEQLDSLCSTFQERLGARLKIHPIELKPVPDIDAGIKVSFNEDAVLHDFSSEAITEMLCGYLNPRILQIIKKEQ